MSCSHCGSQSIPFSDTDREYYCMNCNRGTIRPFVDPIITSEMLEEPQHNKVVVFTCAECKAKDEKKMNSTRRLCRKCERKRNNKKSNELRYKREWYHSTNKSAQDCIFCKREIRAGAVRYKRKHTTDFMCKKCYQEKFGRKEKREAA